MIRKLSHLLCSAGLVLAVCSCAPVIIESTPSGASVYDDSETLLGTTPYKTDLFLSSREYTVRKAGFVDESVAVDASSPSTISLDLQPRIVTLYSKPTANVYSTGSAAPIGRTPVRIQVTEEAQAYTLKLANHSDKVITVDLDSQDLIRTELELLPIVNLSTDPKDADIYEKGKKLGTAPLKTEIRTSRTFEIKKDGYFTKEITLKEVPPFEVSVKLDAFPLIKVETTPAKAEIQIDNQKRTAPVQLAVGSKTTLNVSAPRYYPQTVTISPKSEQVVRVNLKAMPYVTIKSQTAGAQVYLNNKLLGNTPIEQLVEKETVVELRAEGYVTKTLTLTGSDKTVEASLEKVPEPVVVAEPVVEPASAESELIADEVTEQKPVVIKKETKDESDVPGKGFLFIVLGGVLVAVGVFFIVMKRKK